MLIDSYEKVFIVQEQLIMSDSNSEFTPNLPMTLEQVLNNGSAIDQLEDVQEDVKAKFLIKLVSVFNRHMERTQRQRLI